MEIFRSSNTFSPIGTNLSRTDCTFHIFNKIKDTFTEIVVKDQKCGRNTCTCQKEIKMHFMIDSQPITPPSAQNNLISPAPIIQRQRRIIRNNGITLPIIKNPIPVIFFCHIQTNSPTDMEKIIHPLSTLTVRISMIMQSRQPLQEKMKNAYCITSSLIFFATVSILFIQ